VASRSAASTNFTRACRTGRAAILDIDLSALLALGAVPKQYTPLQRYPSSAFDLSVVTGLRELSGELRKARRRRRRRECESVDYLYAYRGTPLADDRQSLTYRVSSRPRHTLSNDETSTVRSGIIDALRAAGYQLRV